MAHVPPEVDAWIIAHCRLYGIQLHVAPAEADSMCGKLAKDGDVDAVITFDGDLGVYEGVSHLIVADSKQQGTYRHVRVADIVGHKLGALNLERWQLFDFRTVAAAAGTDYLQRVDGYGWKSLVDLYNSLEGTVDSVLNSPLKFGSARLREC